MAVSAGISDDALREAINKLEELARDEYDATLNELFTKDEPVSGDEYDYRTHDVRDAHDAFWRVGRLIGITVKEPFALDPTPRKGEESQTGALRVWNLNAKALASEHPDWWQYRLIADFLADEDPVGEFDWLPSKENLSEAEQIERFFREAQSERGVFRALAKSARNHLCNNKKIEAAVTGSGTSATQASSDASVTPKRQQGEEPPTAKGRITVDPVQATAQLVTQGAATAIIAEVPWLDARMAPFVAGLLLLISARGLDGFCSRTVPSPTPGVVET